ncbi:MAG: nucleotide exchange factor GrpE [Planctomycetaceae bacterium]
MTTEQEPSDDPVDSSSSYDEAIVEQAIEETRDEQMDRLRSEVEDANNRVLMAQADLENFRKRMRRDVEDQIRFAAIPVISDLLQVRDNLVRAIDAAASAESEAASIDGLREGVRMLIKQFDDTLGKHGISSIPAVGEPFDPNVHQAIAQVPNADHPAGVIAHEAVTGFQMHGRVIRPSQVLVSTGPA